MRVGGGAPGSRPRLGHVQRSIVSYVLERGLRRFRLSDLARALGADRVRVWWALKSLEARGLVRRVAWGLYEVVEDPNRLASLLARKRARPTWEAPRVDGPRLASATTRCRLLNELQYVVAARGLDGMAGELAIYNEPWDSTNSVRVAWRVPRRALGRPASWGGEASWGDVARALEALLAISLARGPPEHVRWVLRLARSL